MKSSNVDLCGEHVSTHQFIVTITQHAQIYFKKLKS